MANTILRLFFLIGVFEASQAQWRPCIELKRELHVPCKCTIAPDNHRALRMNCDRVIFTSDTLELLRDQPITWLSQKNCGYQRLPEDLLNSGLAIEKLDLSGNSIYRLMDRLLSAQTRLRELRLSDNLLGDNLNPIFSSNEFRDMHLLRLLDLRHNGIRSIEEGIFKGCDNLEELYLDDNNLTAVPAESLKGPKAIRVLSLSGNDIGFLPRGAFSNLGESLLRVDLSRNELSHMEDGSLTGLSHVLFLNLSRNDLTRFNSDVFKGAYNLLQLDLSANFLHEFPSDALRHLQALKFLNVSNNLITEIERTHLTGLAELQVLDLSRNNIGRLGVNTFANLTALTRLDLSLNALRTIEESSFEGLINLKWLSLQDNNILLVPALAISRLPSLTHLHVEFNRIAALSSELLRSTASSLTSLGLTRNLVREIPARLFQSFENLMNIELSGNMLSSVSQHTFAGLEDSLLNLDLSNNRLTQVSPLPLNNLLSLNLADNNLKRLSPDTFEDLVKLRYLNISGNPLYGGFPPIFPTSLINLDASRTGLQVLPTVLLLNLELLTSLALANNHLQEISEGTFQHLHNLTHIDLSYNAIERIENGAFVGLVNLYELNLRGNRLGSFAGEYFNTGTGLEILDLTDNEIAYLSPTSFVIHPRLRAIHLGQNRLTRFPSEYFKSLQFLERIDLSSNSLRNVAEFAFAQLGNLRELKLSENRIESVDDLAFHNSTQLQILDLSKNVLETLSERTMEGVLRMEYLDLSDNKLTSLPETIFDPARIRSVERINLSQNRFNEIPVKSLQRQSSKLLSLNLAKNRLSEFFTQDIVNTVKYLDLSDNPLSEKAVRGIMGEAKILRSLNLARTGMKSVTRLETPFLKDLNLSGNEIKDIRPAALERATLLENLDISTNRLKDFGNLVNTFKTLAALISLDVSGNLVTNLNESSFVGLDRLRVLRISNLTECTRIEKSAFKNLAKLRELNAQDYPRLGYFDVQGILRPMQNIEFLDVEIKDSTVGNELLSIRMHPRLRELTLRGERLRSILSSALAGVRSSQLHLGIKNSSIDAIPAALLFPVPRSTRLDIDVSGSNFSTIPAQFIAALDERSGMIRLRGLETNPIICDCEAKHLWRWLKMSSHRMRIECRGPEHLKAMILTDISEELLSCERITSTRKFYTTEQITTKTTMTSMRSTSSEPEIIWTAAPTINDNSRNKQYNGEVGGSSVIGGSTGTDDTLIIGIVGGVVAFIAIVIIIICICRLRWSNQVNEARMAAMASSIHEASVIRPASAYSGKINHEAYVGSFNGSTLGHPNVHPNTLPNTAPVQMMSYVQPMHMMHQPPIHPSQTNNQPIYGYYDTGNPSLPMYMTCAPGDQKFDR
ncbi:protein artichoke isoform X2 [Venturia canescens]|uniref:protein artichoke isoform X2 n=1 Tax=Venturia canescens TaxID=32260 RepID=UPI001C9D3961|nr:protein artichoke isoform X2 [Venturia canescens]